MIQHTQETKHIRDNPSSKYKVSHVFDLVLFADAKSPAAVQSQPSVLLCCSLSLADMTNDNQDGFFLGVVNKKYVKTLYGAIHGISSLLSVVLGHYLFIKRVLLGCNVVGTNNLNGQLLLSTFLWSNLVSAGIVALLYWNKVQSWLLEQKEKPTGAVRVKQYIQNYNRGRGTLSILLYCAYPLAQGTFPKKWLDNSIVSTLFAISLLGLAFKNYCLIRHVAKAHFVYYGFEQVLLALSILSYGNMTAMAHAHEDLLNHSIKGTVFVVTVVQFGFLWYYVCSRGLASTAVAQKVCKYHHFTLLFTYIGQLHYNCAWWMLPKYMWLQLILVTGSTFMLLVKLMKMHR
jgi:hypothetical protein